MLTNRAKTELLADPRFELMPFDSIEKQVSHLPDDATITITASPSLGLEDTVTWAENLAEDGYEVIPHIAARYVESEDHLDEIANRLDAAGVTAMFVPGGDREEPVGEFDSAYQLLTSLDDLGHEFDDIGITGYPEGHQFLDNEELAESMEQKAPYATYIATQICYDPEAIVDWIDLIRDERGIDLPVDVGIPGVMKYQRLIGISRKVGVGDSVRFLQKTTGILGFLREFIGSRGKYEPDDLIDGLAPYTDDPHYNIRGLHIYTFNQVPDTEAWRTGRLEA
ncbi:methylenetetrahydrofolate reductase [Halobacteriales archaeon QH_10_65_19]|jgi:methylenetetrahydrofolate reductase (NADPH)|nr:MAG: methylenetetrahydrofolate reductase [Halobacteriales archaeon QH_10_65_19]